MMADREKEFLWNIVEVLTHFIMSMSMIDLKLTDRIKKSIGSALQTILMAFLLLFFYRLFALFFSFCVGSHRFLTSYSQSSQKQVKYMNGSLVQLPLHIHTFYASILKLNALLLLPDGTPSVVQHTHTQRLYHKWMTFSIMFTFLSDSFSLCFIDWTPLVQSSMHTMYKLIGILLISQQHLTVQNSIRIDD